MWCLVLTGPCCCGPCQARISTGARIVFLINIVIFFSAIIYTAVFYTSPTAVDLGKDKEGEMISIQTVIFSFPWWLHDNPEHLWSGRIEEEPFLPASTGYLAAEDKAERQAPVLPAGAVGCHLRSADPFVVHALCTGFGSHLHQVSCF